MNWDVLRSGDILQESENLSEYILNTILPVSTVICSIMYNRGIDALHLWKVHTFICCKIFPFQINALFYFLLIKDINQNNCLSSCLIIYNVS